MTGDALTPCSTTAECSNGPGLFRTVTTSVTVGGAVTSAGLPDLQRILALLSPLTLKTVAVADVVLIFVVVVLLLRV